MDIFDGKISVNECPNMDYTYEKATNQLEYGFII